MSSTYETPTAVGAETLRHILDKARWAPSGDNTQPWRFEIVSDSHVVIHGHDTRDHCVYDLRGHASQMSLGALLETLAIAASGHGLRAEIVRRNDAPERTPTFDVHLVPDATLQASPLIGAIETRSVQRRPMSTRSLTAAEKQALEAAVGPGYRVQWLEGWGERFKTARLMFANAKLRLTMPEAFEVHRSIIDWNCRTSEDKVPDQALGLDAMTLKLMRWAMHSWQRMARLNAVVGTWAPRLQMDLLPALACGAHFVLRAQARPATLDDHIAAGRALQRFWLTLTHLGLCMQPEGTPLIFGAYLADGVRFTREERLEAMAHRLRGRLEDLIGVETTHPVFMGRIGAGPAPTSRSTRKPVDRLMT